MAEIVVNDHCVSDDHSDPLRQSRVTSATIHDGPEASHLRVVVECYNPDKWLAHLSAVIAEAYRLGVESGAKR